MSNINYDVRDMQPQDGFVYLLWNDFTYKGYLPFSLRDFMMALMLMVFPFPIQNHVSAA
jgi:hypothetical protein